MKKVVLTIAIAMMMGLGASAQSQSDKFFGAWNSNSGNRGTQSEISNVTPALPNAELGNTNDQSAPLGGGLLVLGMLGAGYAVARRKHAE